MQRKTLESNDSPTVVVVFFREYTRTEKKIDSKVEVDGKGKGRLAVYPVSRSKKNELRQAPQNEEETKKTEEEEEEGGEKTKQTKKTHSCCCVTFHPCVCLCEPGWCAHWLHLLLRLPTCVPQDDVDRRTEQK